MRDASRLRPPRRAIGAQLVEESWAVMPACPLDHPADSASTLDAQSVLDEKQRG
jgi:hypothetical protein